MFLRQNLRAVGVEEIVKQANVAKISLYRSFASGTCCRK
ncbi:TetR family transcriptional regulator [Paraburkholderia fungorum]